MEYIYKLKKNIKNIGCESGMYFPPPTGVNC